MALGGYPKLKGKATEIKAILPAIYWAWCEGYDATDENHVAIKLMLAASVRMDDMITEYASYFRFPEAVGDELFQNCALYAQLNTKVSNLYSLRLFNVTQKHHYLLPSVRSRVIFESEIHMVLCRRKLHAEDEETHLFMLQRHKR